MSAIDAIYAVVSDPAFRFRAGVIGARPWLSEKNHARAREVLHLLREQRNYEAVQTFMPLLDMWCWRDEAPYSWTRTWLTDAMRKLKRELRHADDCTGGRCTCGFSARMEELTTE